ncbi:MAG: hypothetical protein LBT53_04100 [Puniceicoccales bacterium]|nr:hypothetical protein [Puniceicoccales bacterium]
MNALSLFFLAAATTAAATCLPKASAQNPTATSTTTIATIAATAPAFVATSIHATALAPAAVSLELQNAAGFRFAPADIVFFLFNKKNSKHIFLSPSVVRRTGQFSGELAGKTEVGGATFSYQIKIALDPAAPAASFTPSWSVDKDLDGWEVAFAYQRGFTGDWRVQLYPFAGNSESVSVNPLRYCGVPGALLYKKDLSSVLFFALDSRSDYLNPTTWTGKTRFAFSNGAVNPAFYAGGGQLKAGVAYELPLQLFSDNSGKFTTAIPNIVKNWMRTNDYKVDTSLFVRTPQEAFDIGAAARDNPKFWIKGIGYEHHRGTPFVYPAENPFFALLDYILFSETGKKDNRDRAFHLVDFLLKGQQPNGAFHTSYWFRAGGSKGNLKHSIAHSGTRPEKGYSSWDWGHHAYKIDINAMAAQNLLILWQLVKEKEGIDKKEWRDAAVRSLEWIISQQNADGGFPQCVDVKTGQKSISTVNGRLLVALPRAAKITGDKRYLEKAAQAEKFLREKVQNRIWFTGAHPDLPPEDFEQDSLPLVIEFWLDKYERTGEKDALENAVANAYLNLLFWCPKQLSWVKNPTQTAHSEQQNYNQYSVYSYNNKKLSVLHRLHKYTNNPLFEQLKNRVMQMNFYTQLASGPYKGAQYEAIADPWLERRHGFNNMNSPYTSELVVDVLVQLYELGLAKPKKADAPK